MAIVRCTKKLLKELKARPTDETDYSDPLGSWHANLLWIDHKKCVLFANDATLYSFLVPGLKKPDFQDIRHVFGQWLFKNLLWEGFSQVQIETILDEHREISISKSNSRSVLGSMNELTFQLKWEIASSGGLRNTDLAALNHYLNRIPMGAIPEVFSIKELKALLSNG